MNFTEAQIEQLNKVQLHIHGYTLQRTCFACPEQYDVFGHLGTADEVGNEWHQKTRDYEALEKAAKAVIERWDTLLLRCVRLWKGVTNEGLLWCFY